MTFQQEQIYKILLNVQKIIMAQKVNAINKKSL